MQFVALPQDRPDSCGTVPCTVASGTAFQAKSLQTSDTGEPCGRTTQSCGAPQASRPFRLHFWALLQIADRSGEASCQPALSQMVACVAEEVSMQKAPHEHDRLPGKGALNPEPQLLPFQVVEI